MGPTLCWHVHLFQFAPTPANPSGLLHRFPSCKKLNQMSSLHAKKRWHVHCSPLNNAVAALRIVTSRDPQTLYLDHQQYTLLFVATLDSWFTISSR